METLTRKLLNENSTQFGIPIARKLAKIIAYFIGA